MMYNTKSSNWANNRSLEKPSNHLYLQGHYMRWNLGPVKSLAQLSECTYPMTRRCLGLCIIVGLKI